MIDENDPSQHPALQGFSRTWESIKFVAGKTLRWMALGAIILGIGFCIIGGAVPAVGAVLGSLVPGWLGGALLVGKSTAAFASVAKAGLAWGAIGGAVFGALKGIAGAGEAVEDALQDRISDYNLNRATNERRQVMAAQRQQGLVAAAGQASGPVAPTIGRSGPESGRGART